MASTITTSVVTGGTNSHATTSYEVNGVATDFIHAGVVGPLTNTAGVSPATGSFAVNAQGTPAMLVDVSAGVAYITATPSGQASQKLRAYMSATYTSYAIASNASGSTKYDWIYLKVDPTAANNPASDASDVTALYTSRSSSNTTDNGSPPTYGTPLAIVAVANGASSITNSNITDARRVATFRSSPAASGVNAVDVSTSATGNAPALTATGDDANIDLKLVGKGTGYPWLSGGKIKGLVGGRQGGSSTAWATNGTTNQTVNTVGALIQCGVIRTSTGADVTVTFPVAFSNTPVVAFGSTLVNNSTFMRIGSGTLSATSFNVSSVKGDGTRSADDCHWIAIGPA